MLHQTKAASDGSTASLPSTGAFSIATGGLSSTPTSARLLAPLTRIMNSAKTRMSVTGDPAAGFDPDPLIAALRDKLFTDANYLGDGIYRVPASLVCSSETVDPNGTITTTIDPDCAHALAQSQLQIRVEDDGNAIRFWIQIDSDHDEPLGFLLAHDELGITVNLDDAGHALTALATLFGQQAPNVALAGQITGDLKVLGTAHAKASLTFDRALSIAFADEGIDLAGPAATRFASAAGEIISIELDGNAPRAEGKLGIGETTIHTPGDSLDPRATDVDLAGVTIDAVAQGNSITLTNLSLGGKTTTVKKDGVLATAIDLNPDDGRKLSATLTGDAATGTATLTVSPLLDERQTIDHAVLGDTAPVYDVTRVLLDGSLRGADGSGQVEVLSGSFSVSTSPAQYGFAASAGQCVTSTDTYDSAVGDYYSLFSVGACL